MGLGLCTLQGLRAHRTVQPRRQSRTPTPDQQPISQSANQQLASRPISLLGKRCPLSAVSADCCRHQLTGHLALAPAPGVTALGEAVLSRLVQGNSAIGRPILSRLLPRSRMTTLKMAWEIARASLGRAAGGASCPRPDRGWPPTPHKQTRVSGAGFRPRVQTRAPPASRAASKGGHAA